ncbi:MAG: hypothetical protein H6Q90_2017 [Deltaproteobacteria bacterium]|nr:hypothetical protein [Deltaproteobacteria bacterium]
MRLLIIVILLLGAAGPASAQAPGETRVTPVPRKSLLDAYLISIGATALPYAAAALASGGNTEGPRADLCFVIAGAATVLGPSAGHWYVGRYVTTGLVLRVGAAGGVVALAIASPRLDDDGAVFSGLMGAVALWEVGLVWDLVTLPRAVRRSNTAHQLRVAPLFTTTANGPVTGLSLGGDF